MEVLKLEEGTGAFEICVARYNFQTENPGVGFVCVFEINFQRDR